jgi:hypothetical protein
MAFTAKQAYAIREWAKNNPGLSPQMREWNRLIDETIGTASGGFPTTTTTTTTSSSTTTTTA